MVADHERGISTEQNTAEAGAQARLGGKKILFILPPQNFREEEFQKPRAYLLDAGASIRIASRSREPAHGMQAGVVTPDVAIRDVKAADFDAVLLVGGTGSSAFWHDEDVHKLVREVSLSGGVVGAICLAPVTLANAGLLTGRMATAFSSAGDFLTWRGATYTGKRVEQSGNIITANGPDASEEFARLLGNALEKAELNRASRPGVEGQHSLET